MKKVLSIILSVIFIFSIMPTGAFSVAASAVTSGTTGECTWTLDGTVLTIGGNGTMGNYNYNNPSPWGKDITEVIIENGVTSIGSYAFYFCRALKSITVPGGLNSIGDSAFESCDSLPGIVIPEGVASIGNEAFRWCSKLSEVILPDSIVSIGEDAFNLCRLKSITIPQNVSSIGAGAFSYCPVTSIEVDENNSTYYSANNCIIKKSTNALIAGCNSSVIPDGVTSIEDDAFRGCSARVNITIPDSVTRIGGWAFGGSDFTSITMPKSVASIASGAFYLCDYLTDVYYSGNRVDKGKINISAYSNEDLINANWHFAPCENNAHIYDYNCATTCKNCDYIRTADAAHVFDNDCDEVCNICGGHRKVKHIFEQIGENAATCEVCNISKTFDFIINTDETITLSYEASKEFDFTVENTSIAKIVNVSGSVVSMGSYYRKVSNAKISPVCPGETAVNVIDSNGDVLTSSTLLVVEGEHQMQLAEVITPATCTDNGIGIYHCKFCDYEEQRVIYALEHIEIIDAYVAPTCTETGLTEGAHCSRCNKIIVAQQTISAAGHSYSSSITKEATCSTTGVRTHTCDKCNSSYTTTISATGNHTYGNWVEVNDTTHKHICAICSKEETANHTRGNKGACTGCGMAMYIPGDVDGIKGVTDADAVYLLYHTFLPDMYLVNQDCDFNGDGEVTDQDAVYLLYHTFLPENYPIG